jgi:CspA family cold shock protein
MKVTGTVKWYNSTKGYGFIAPDNGSKDIFIHRSAVEEAGLDGLNDNQKIKFEIILSQGKESAGNIELI